jgi:hypothetical protein
MRWAAVAGAVVGVIEVPLAAGFDRPAAARAEHPTLFDVGEPLSAESGVALAVAALGGCSTLVDGDAASLTWTVYSATYVAGSRQAHRIALSSRMVVVVLLRGVIVGTVGLAGGEVRDGTRDQSRDGGVAFVCQASKLVDVLWCDARGDGRVPGADAHESLSAEAGTVSCRLVALRFVLRGRILQLVHIVYGARTFTCQARG